MVESVLSTLSKPDWMKLPDTGGLYHTTGGKQTVCFL